MAEVVGLAANILALATTIETVASSLRLAFEFYNAPAEIKALQEQVELIGGALQAIDPMINASIQAPLSKAKSIVDELQELIVDKLIKPRGEVIGARRWAWLLNKRRLTRLLKTLQESREALSLSIGANILSCTHRLEVSLDIIRSQRPRTQLLIRGFADGPETIDEAFGQGLQVVKKSPRGLGGVIVCAGNDSESEESRTFTKSPSELRRKAINPVKSSLSSFERSNLFFPESYTVEQEVRALFCYDVREIMSTEFYRVNECKMFFLQAPRHWIRLTLMITINVDSRCWNLWQDGTGAPADTLPFDQILRMKIILAKHLASLDGLGQDYQMTGHLGSDLVNEHNISTKLLVRPAAHLDECLLEATSYIYHLNCPRYAEQELVTYPAYKKRPSNRFFAFLQGRWVLKHQLSGIKRHIAHEMYLLKALYCLRGTKGISPFVGAVIDNRGLISGFLCELPVGGQMFHVITRARKSGELLATCRLEKWCRQIVDAVAQIHAKGFVLGSLAESLVAGIGLDGGDNVVIHDCLRESFDYDSDHLASVPPEYHGSISKEGRINATPQTDMYQLGQILWCIISGGASKSDSALRGANWSAANDTMCSDEQQTLIHLPLPQTQIPQYLRDIINACRLEDPNERPPAWELLQRFPFASEKELAHKHGCDCPKTFTRPITRLEDCWETVDDVASCNQCGQENLDHFLHCQVCLGGNYHICFTCFRRGDLCLGRDHYLQEFHHGCISPFRLQKDMQKQTALTFKRLGQKVE